MDPKKRREHANQGHDKKKNGFSFCAVFPKKIHWNYFFLAFIIFIGFFGTCFLPSPMNTPGRVYHIDAPSIGYHNMKENEYLSQALNQWNDGDYFRRRMHILGLDPGPGYFEEYPQPPLIPWMILGAWAFTGIQFWSARLIIVFFSIATIPTLYLLVRRLSQGDEYLALTTAFIYSILPISVFFGRNIQPESPALFFLVLGLYFYIRWIEDFTTRNIVISGLALMMCAMFKPTFLIGMIPMLFVFPFSNSDSLLRGKEQSEDKKNSGRNTTLLQLGIFAACFLPYFIWNWITAAFLNTKEALLAGTSSRIDLFSLFTPSYWSEYWPSINLFLQDNFALWFLWLAVLGFAFLLLRYRSTLSKFCIGYAIAAIPYGVILADYINRHSYYQMPFVPLICICSAYCICTIGLYIEKLITVRHSKYCALVILVCAIPSTAAFTNVHYDTIYFGLDVGAGFLKTHTTPDERFFIEGESQTVGVCYNADRRCDQISNVSELMMAERQLNFTAGFIHVSKGGLYTLFHKPDMYDYIQKNYRITQIGMIPQEGGAAVQYIIVQKGGNSDLKNLTENSVAKTPPVPVKSYTTTYGKVPFYVRCESF